MKKRTRIITILAAVLVFASVVSVAAVSAAAADKAAVEEKIASIEDVYLMKTDKAALSFVRTRASYEKPLSSGSIRNSLTGITKERSERKYDVYKNAEGTEYVYIAGTDIVCGMTFTYHPSDKNSDLTTMEYIGEEAADEVAKAYMASVMSNFEKYELLSCEWDKNLWCYTLRYAYTICGCPTNDIVVINVTNDKTIRGWAAEKVGDFYNLDVTEEQIARAEKKAYAKLNKDVNAADKNEAHGLIFDKNGNLCYMASENGNYVLIPVQK